MQRGELWWASLPVPTGSEPGYRRPVLVVQVDEFNRSGIRTVIAVALTTNMRLAEAPGNVRLSRSTTGLPRDSVANVSQIVTLDKVFLAERCARLPDEVIRQIEDGLRLVLAL